MPTYVHLRTISLGIPGRPATQDPYLRLRRRVLIAGSCRAPGGEQCAFSAFDCIFFFRILR